MGRAVSLHVGIQRLRAEIYGEVSPLASPEADALAWQGFAAARGFDARLLLSEAATHDGVVGAIRGIAEELAAAADEGDPIFLLTYAGHGTSLPGEDESGDEGDGADEAWCAYDGLILDDELAALWAAFPAGSRVVIIADSCHSGSVALMGEVPIVLPPDGLVSGWPLAFEAFRPFSGHRWMRARPLPIERPRRIDTPHPEPIERPRRIATPPPVERPLAERLRRVERGGERIVGPRRFGGKLELVEMPRSSPFPDGRQRFLHLSSKVRREVGPPAQAHAAAGPDIVPDDILADVLLLAAAQDWQAAYESESGGFWTTALLAAASDSSLSWKGLFERAATAVLEKAAPAFEQDPFAQEPRLFTDLVRRPTLLDQPAFSPAPLGGDPAQPAPREGVPEPTPAPPTPVSRALLIGSATAGLSGCDRDVARMKGVLEARGFQVDARCGEQATRAGILEGYEALIAATKRDDVAVVFYSGHGALVKNPDADRPGEPAHYQCIVPFDFDLSKDGDFRGITSFELSGLLSRLTDEETGTENAIVILDCCHAARMSRSLKARRAKALDEPSAVDIRAHLDALRQAGVSLGVSGQDSNPRAVRVVACGLLQSAWECLSDEGEIGGALTDALVRTLEEAGSTDVTWEAVGRRARDRVLGSFPAQRPEIEGPLRRYLFSTKEQAPDGRLGVRVSEQGVFLQGGLLLDVREGDEYDLFGLGDSGAPLAKAVVKGAPRPTEADLAVTPPDAPLPEGAQAVLTRRTGPRAPIALRGSEAEIKELAEAVKRCPLTQVAGPGEAPLATLSVELGNLAIRDYAGDLLAVPRPFAPALGRLDPSLRSIAKAQAMRKLRSSANPGFPESAFAVSWGVVEGGHERALPLSGARLKAGESMFIRMENRSAITLYFTALDVGVSQSVSLLSTSLSSGVPIEPGGAPYVLGRDAPKFELIGRPMRWPKTVPIPADRVDVAREEEFVIIVTDRPQDLRPAETIGVRSSPTPGSTRVLTEEEAEIDQLFTGRTRDARRPVRPSAFRVVHIDFFLVP